MQHYHWQDNTLILHCHVQPGAKRSELMGVHGERLKVRLSAPPVDGKANAQLIRFLCHVFAVGKADVAIRRGQTSRQKSVAIVNPGSLPPVCEISPVENPEQ